ncbi:MAG: SdrD B-like domain-containing protein [Ilumatobacteraceae bacterium]
MLTYTISYDCSGIGAGDNCAGALITDTLPTFTDIYGNLNQLELVSASATSPSDWTFQGVSGTVPTKQVSWLGTNTLIAGDTGAVVLTLRVPLGVVPFTPISQLVSNTANVALAGQADDQAGPALSYINALPPASTIAKSGPTEALLNAAGTDNISHTITVCPQPNRPLWENYTITDTLPPGVTVVTPLPFGGVFTPGTPSTSAPGPLPGDPPVITPGTGGTIVWNLTPANKPATDAQGCLPITFQVNYKNAFAGGDLTNVIGNTKTNSVSAVGSNPGGGTQNIGPATTTLTLIGPVTRFAPSKNANGNYYVQNGDTVTYNLGASNTSDAEALAFSAATLTDGPFPTGYTLTTINTGTWTGAVATVTASIETSPDGSTWTPVSTAPSATIVAAPGVKYVRWVFTSVGAPAIGPGWVASGQQLIGTIAGSPPPSVVLTNCVGLSGVQSGVTQDRGQACAPVELETPKPHPSITKSAPAAIEPGQTITYSLVAANNIDATGDLVNPQLTDCVPDSSRLVVSNLRAGGVALPANGWTIESGPTPNSCTPTAPATANSGTFIQLQYTGTLTPGQAAPTITYDLTADAFQVPTITDTPALPGTYTNTVKITKGDGGAFDHCVQAGCQASATVVVPIVAQLQSEKQVLGSLDVAFNKAGTTTPGGQVEWKIEVQNTGNVEVENVQYVDVFGYVGDTGVRRTDQKRGSEYVPYLTSPIATTAGWTVEYSKSNNPCRPEVLGPNTGCDAPNWTATPDPLDLPLYRSIRLTYTGRILIGQTLSFQYDMVSPVFDPTYDTPNTTGSPYDQLNSCTIPDSTPAYNPLLPSPNLSGPGNSTLAPGRPEVTAWVDDGAGGGIALDGIQQPGEGGPTCPRSSNSFAYGVSVPTDQLGGLPNPGRLGAEPPKVDVFVAAVPLLNVIGDRVWEDVNNNGIQDGGEPGIAFVRVELYDNLGNLVDTTFTDLNGNYLFEQLPDGVYTVRFYMPDERGYISPQDQSGVTPDVGASNTNNDSDIPQIPTGNALGGNYYTTVPVTLGGPTPEADPTWDAGIWIPKPAIALKKYVNGNDAQTAPGVNIPKGAPVTWTYDITNTGNTYLKNVTLTDLVTISGQPNPVPVCNWATSSDPLTPANVLSRGETVSCTATGTAITGQYGNNATVVGTPTLDDGTTAITGKVDAAGNPLPTSVTASDPAHYFGVEYDLAISKVADVIAVAQGGNVTWTIRVVNQGNVASLAYTVTDTIPNGLTVSGTPSAVPAATSSSNVGRVYNWVMPSLAPGATADITIVTTVTDITQRPYRNWAEISADSAATYNTTDFDSTPNTNTGDDTTAGLGGTPDDQFIDNTSLANIPDTVAGDEDDNDLAIVAGTVTYDLALVKTVNPTPLIGADGLATWTITIKNQGNVASRAYTVTDNVPGGLQVLSASPAATSSAGRTLTWNMPNLAPGATATITINTKVTDQSKKPFVNWAEISSDGSSFYSIAGDTVVDVDSTPDAFLGDDPNTGSGTGPTNSAATPELNIDRVANSDVNTDIANDEDDSDQAVLGSDVLYDLALVKVVDAPTVAPNGVITWTISVKNQGNVNSNAYTVTDTIPTGLAVTTGTTPSSSNSGQVYNWVMPSLAPGATATITIKTTITDINKRPFRNWAEISSDSAADYGTTDVDSVPDTITGADTGAGTNFGDPPNDLVVDRLNTTDVNTDLGAQTDQDDNDFAQVDVPITYDLALKKTVSPTTVAQDGTVTWTITVYNQGNVDSGNVVVRDTLPGGITFVSAVPDISGNPAAGIYTWNITNLAPGNSTTIVITSTATDLKLRPFRNWAEISVDSANTYTVPGFPVVKDVDSTPDTNTGSDPGAGTGVDPNDAPYIDDEILKTPATGDEDDNDLAEVGSNVIYDLALAKVAEATPVAYNGQPTWRVRVYNQGNVTSGAVVVTDKLPTGLSFSSAQVLTSGGLPLAGGSCGNVTFTVSCNIPNIAAGGYVDIVIVSTITGGNLSTAPWRNWAEISSDSAQQLYGVDDIDSVPSTETGRDNTLPTDDNYVGVPALGATYPPSLGQPNTFNDPAVDSDDNDDAVITTSSFYDLALAKTVSANVVQYNDTITYTITIKNQGNVPSGVYSVTDKFPVGLNLDSFTAGGAYDSINRVLTWTNLPNLNPGQTKVLTVTATIGDITKRPFRNYAEISQDSAQTLYGINDVDSTPDADTTNDGTYPVLALLPTGPSGGDNASIDDAGVNPDAQDDADIADVGVNVVYDLALAKVVDQTDLALKGYETGTATFTLTIKNQGTVPSNDFVVTDWVPVGIEPVTPIANGGVWNSTDRTITWTVAQLLPGVQITRAYTVTVSDITKQPWRNLAEISADSAVDYLAPTDVNSGKDVDSTPDLTKDNDGTYPPLGSDPGTGIDNLTIGDAGVRGNDPQDDADIADLGFNVVYDLALAKVVNANTVAYNVGTHAYDPITFTLTVQNQGNVDSKQFVVTDTVPAGLTPVEPIANGGVWAPGPRTITWTIGNLNGSPQLNPGESITLTYTATITDVTKRPFRNFAEISADGADNYDNLTRDVEDKDSIPDANTANDGTYPTLTNTPADPSGIDNFGPNAIDQAGVGADAQIFGPGDIPVAGPQDDADIADVWVPITYDLALAKTVNANTVAYNDTITYTIVVKNQGNVPSLDFDVTDTVPAGLAVADAGGGNTGTAGKVIWTIANLEPGATKTLTWTATIADITKRPFRNYAEISRDSASDYSTTNPDGGVVAVVTDVDSKPDSNTGNDGTYPDLTNTPAAPSGIDNSGPNAIDQAGVGGDAGTTPPTDGPQDDADIADVWVPVTYDLALSKVAKVDGSTDTSSIAYNDTITYTITVKNQGNVPSHDFVVTDAVPAGLTVVNAGGGVAGAGTLTWTIDNLDPGATRDLVFTATIADLTKRPYRNFAEISADSASDYSTLGHDQATPITVVDIDSVPDADQTNDGQYPDLVEHPVQGEGIDNLVIGDAGTGADAPPIIGDPASGGQDDADIADVGVDVVYDLALAKVASASTMAVDGSMVFTITVKNQGTVPSGDFVITDTLPVGMKATAASDGGNTGVAGKVTWTVANLDPGQSTTRTVTVVITDITKRPFKNIAEISADSADDYDVPSRPAFTTPIDVEDADSIPDATTTNDNGSSGTGPDGYGSYQNPTNDVTTIGPSEGPGVGGQDDADVAFVDAPVVYDLALVKTGRSTFDGFSDAEFTIVVKNQGNVASGDYTVLDTVPDGLSAQSASDGGVIAGNTVTWKLTGLAPGATRTLTVTLRLVDIAKRPYRNYAEISSDGADIYDSINYETPTRGDVEDADSIPNTNIADDVLVDQVELPTDQYNDPKVDEDDHDIADITVLLPDVVVVKSADKTAVLSGQSVGFTLTVTNKGPGPARNVVLVDTLPAGMEPETLPANLKYNAATRQLTWTVGDLAPVATVSVFYTVTITATDGPLLNVVVVSSSSPGEPTSNNNSEVPVGILPPEEIPVTGSDIAPLLSLAAGLLAAGATGVFISRRRRHLTR